MTRHSSPYTLRLGYNQTWNTIFFSSTISEQLLLIGRDKALRDYFASLSIDIANLKIEYEKNVIFIFLYLTDVNVLLGEENENLDKILKKVYSIINDPKISAKINVIGIRKFYSNAQTIASIIATQLKQRARSRFVVKTVLAKVAAEKENKGIKIILKGLIDETDMAQTKKFLWGKTSLNTIDNNIEYAYIPVTTRRGIVSVKVYLNLGPKFSI